MQPPSWSTLIMIAIGAFLAFNMYRKSAGKASVEEVRKLLAGGAQLIDVRSPAEYQSGHLPGAKNIPVSELKDRSSELGEKDRDVVVYCRSGVRSEKAASLLKRQGFSRVSDLGAMARFQ